MQIVVHGVDLLTKGQLRALTANVRPPWLSTLLSDLLDWPSDKIIIGLPVVDDRIWTSGYISRLKKRAGGYSHGGRFMDWDQIHQCHSAPVALALIQQKIGQIR